MAAETRTIAAKKSERDKRPNIVQGSEESREHGVADEKPIEVEEASPKSNKRKREALSSELEIDLSLPEPPSKKALRKAKKHKSQESNSKYTAPDNAKGPKAELELPTSATTESKNPRRSNFAIWIGNLPWHATKTDLRAFITTQAPSISDSQITRIHMPVPDAPSHRMYRNGQKPSNKGFAYVDFDSSNTLEAALKLTELEFKESGRRVLVKNAASFEGRPDVNDGKGWDKQLDKASGLQKPASKRVFVGNLAFDVTREDLERHYGQCGQVVDVHVATFEDSGKCKGFAWVTFDSVEAGEAAARGYVWREQDGEESEEDDREGTRKKRKPIKWWVNRLNGRDLRVEFAEDASFRYRKRFGSEAKNKSKKEDVVRGPVEEVVDPNPKKDVNEQRREMRKSSKGTQIKAQPKVVINAAKINGAIVEGQGKKITFN